MGGRSTESCVNSAIEDMNSLNFLTVSRDVEYVVEHSGVLLEIRSIMLCASSENMKAIKFVKASQRTKNRFYCQYPYEDSFLLENRRKPSKNREAKEMMPSSGHEVL